MIKKRVGVLISGRGSNMRALVEASSQNDYPAEIVFVGSNYPEAAGLAFAHKHGIPTAVVDHRNFASREAFDGALHLELTRHNLDIICCAGFMRIMTSVLIKPWSGRMLNIHPSLLPHYKGLHTHARALADGATRHGASVHFVSEELDGGQVIEQVPLAILPDDTVEKLTARVLVTLSAVFLPTLLLYQQITTHIL